MHLKENSIELLKEMAQDFDLENLESVKEEFQKAIPLSLIFAMNAYSQIVPKQGADKYYLYKIPYV